MAGLQVWDAGGRLMIDTSTVSLLILGEITVGGEGAPQTGSFYDSRLSLGRPFHAIVSGPFPSKEQNFPTFSFSGQSLTWRYVYADSAAYRRQVTRVIYGIR